MGQDFEELSTDTTTTGTTGTTRAAAGTTGAAVGDVGGRSSAGAEPVAGTTTTPADIEATRASLSRDIDELTDKVSPARVVDRRKEAVKGRLGSVRDSVMGAAPDLGAVKDKLPGTGSGSGGASGPGLSERASGAASAASGAVGTVGARAQGNPLAAGLVAFGVGMLVSAVIPASEKEARVAGQAVEAAKEHGQPVLEEAKSVGQQIGADLKESATESAQQVKDTAQESVATVKAEGQSSAQTVKDDATPTS
jgi:gas vesicle protein